MGSLSQLRQGGKIDEQIRALEAELVEKHEVRTQIRQAMQQLGHPAAYYEEISPALKDIDEEIRTLEAELAKTRPKPSRFQDNGDDGHYYMLCNRRRLQSLDDLQTGDRIRVLRPGKQTDEEALITSKTVSSLKVLFRTRVEGRISEKYEGDSAINEFLKTVTMFPRN